MVCIRVVYANAAEFLLAEVFLPVDAFFGFVSKMFSIQWYGTSRTTFKNLQARGHYRGRRLIEHINRAVHEEVDSE